MSHAVEAVTHANTGATVVTGGAIVLGFLNANYNVVATICVALTCMAVIAGTGYTIYDKHRTFKLAEKKVSVMKRRTDA